MSQPSAKAAKRSEGATATTASSGTTGKPDTAAKLPTTAHAVVQILSAMGVTSYEPLVVPQLLEFCNRYLHGVLDDSLRYAEHRAPTDEPVINREDVRLAVQSRIDFQMAPPPPREVPSIPHEQPELTWVKI
eukprot:TRINITY_DN7664_c0_g1_i1.p1 TRINITY_DN7664_c0_g1~~TRINITY_DN7664_c0_g1_i1.p1  ORF type:complete len:132 (+),score=13.78 TRINITY_DN7664_c0_g1_i1:252-647(+)